MILGEESIKALTEAVKNIVESSISGSFIEMVLKRLDSFCYEITEKDIYPIAFSIQKVEQTIRNECNTLEIPDGLTCHAVDMVCGDFLSGKYRTGQLELSALDLGGALASVNVGGTSVSFDNNTSDESKFDALISVLSNAGRGQFACYRQIKW